MARWVSDSLVVFVELEIAKGTAASGAASRGEIASSGGAASSSPPSASGALGAGPAALSEQARKSAAGTARSSVDERGKRDPSMMGRA
jgi:hypothetical protein